MKYFLFAICLLATITVSAQEGSDPPIMQFVDNVPKCPYDLGQYLGDNIHYPDSARAHNVEGRVIIKFVVNEDGRISDCTVIKGIGSGCDEEALRVVKAMPRWKPGEQKGKKVKVYFTLPITFKLTD